MQRKARIALTAGIIAVVLGGAGAVVVAATNDSDTPITGTALEQATAAALAHTGQGRVTGTEVGDEDSYYEVEVTLDDGSQVDVQLDKGFHVVETMTDSDTGNGNSDEGGND